MNERTDMERIEISGAREHNLKDIDIEIPRDKLVVITGLSGSGKSSLAFDTIYAEGQRRYIESFSAYARQFIGVLQRPDVDKISGLSPVISIEQKSTNRNPRSTVGTITEIYDFLRLLFARISTAYSYHTGKPMLRLSEEQILARIKDKYSGKRTFFLAPVVTGRKGHYRELFEELAKKGFAKVRTDGEIQDIRYGMRLDRYKTHNIEIVIDRFKVEQSNTQRLNEAIRLAMKHGKGLIMVYDEDSKEVFHFSKFLMCPDTGLSYPEPEPNAFSFNSPYGACPKCNGIGEVSQLDMEKIIPDPKLSIRKGGIIPVGKYRQAWIFKQIEAIGDRYGFDIDMPLDEIPEEGLNVLLYGSNEVFKVKHETVGVNLSYSVSFEGIINFISSRSNEESSQSVRRWAESFMHRIPCPECNGSRLKKDSLHFRISGKNIAELAALDIRCLIKWLSEYEKELLGKEKVVATEILKEVNERLQFLLNVGLDYLSLNRSTNSLSGGESQRIRLATQIGTKLSGVLYILDEPSIGLHPRDNIRLIAALKDLRDNGNSVIVVEHDREMMEAADHIIDLGPGAGRLGGKVVAQGNLNEIRRSTSMTADYITRKRQILPPEKRRDGNGKTIRLINASGNNLKNISVDFPLGKMICVTGVSGSGKSTLINDTLYPALSRHFYKSLRQPLPFGHILGMQLLDKVVEIDQSPIGRTPRSNPATYTKVFDEIRRLFSELQESRIRGYKPGQFSFNVKGGRCEACQGAGVKTIEMNFLPDVFVLCDECYGKRYTRETLEVRYKGKTINDVLEMTINQAVEFFQGIPAIIQKIRTLRDVGLGYITLGQRSPTLSGGEAQRVKLAAELSRRDTGSTLYILDEPTTGLHFEDIRILLDVLQKLTDRGNTIIIIEHNLDVIKMCDHIIDLGPEGGIEGGFVVTSGSPEEIASTKKGYTSTFLAKELRENH
ncbi:MAG: excinuclease ABC subunit UvrA [Bacteroidetes bacterium]|nr:excinuclease ABC subunit UvrA [Bacteroidota bacterium]MBU1720076.1 excinuclease ABC subunit UvrA [Bacteroidota bacterium]